MSRPLALGLLCGALLLAGAPEARAQAADWTPPSRQMPAMPRADELAGDWLSDRSGWFRGVDRVSGVALASLRAIGEPRAGTAPVQIARFMDGPVPAVVWTDQNGDARADLIEIYRSGGVIIQLIDANYDGAADVMRIYDASGALLRQERL